MMFGVYAVDITNNKYDNAFIASMSDGTIESMHYYKNKTQNSLLSSSPDLCWGLNYDRNKIRLPQPVCDIGLLLEYDDDDNDGMGMGIPTNGNSIVTCSRDGNVFVIPLIPMKESNEEYEYDNEARYTQGFTSGYRRAKGWSNNGDNKEVERRQSHQSQLLTPLV